jgi:NADPH-dependent 2,4-dienoyl-CoA reductase/sulfur reductase-like enzyme
MRRPIVIAGGGLAAVRFCQALRRAGDDRPIRMVCEEPLAPYDRPPLSKSLTSEPLRPDGWYAENGVELLLGERAAGIDVHHGALRLEGGAVLPYEALLIATGSRPRAIPGCLSLRTAGDAGALQAVLAPAARLVVVGAGFVGQEVAAAARARGAEVTMVEALPAPLAGLLGADVGGWFAQLHREEGVRVELNVGVDRVAGGAVSLTDGRRIACDAVLAGIGVVPATEWLAGTSLAPGGGPITTDAGGRTALTGVFAAGDVTGGQHWDAAVRQGTAAARTLLGLAPAPPAPPSFWSDQYGIRIQMVGRPAGADAVAMDGDPAARDFAATFTRAGRPVAVLLANRPHELPGARRLLEATPTIERKAA